ncbi:hypothetical protein LTS18_008172, partial [Coniosporium uncinatum]
MPTFPDWQRLASMLEERQGDEVGANDIFGHYDYLNQKLLQRSKRKSALDPYFAAHHEFEKLYKSPSPSLSSDSDSLEPHKDPIRPSMRSGTESRGSTIGAPLDKALGKVRKHSGESSGIVSRTGFYHNTATRRSGNGRSRRRTKVKTRTTSQKSICLAVEDSLLQGRKAEQKTQGTTNRARAEAVSPPPPSTVVE